MALNGRNKDNSNRAADRTPVSADDLSRLHELRDAWGMAINGPLLVVGRLTGSLRDDMPDVFFLSNLTHPTDGHDLVYPDEDPRRGTRAFVPPREIQPWLNAAEAVTGEHWAIAELELAPPSVREQRNNPHECNVRAGTLRLLRALPNEWQIVVQGPGQARLIADFARVEIEASVRAEVLRDSLELADQEVKNRQLRQGIEDELRTVQDQANDQRAQFEAQVAQGRRLRDAVNTEVQDLQVLRAAETQRLDELRLIAEQKRNAMADRYRKLENLLSEKGRRLIALGLIDEEDLDFVRPPSLEDSERMIPGLEEALGGENTRLAAWLQARLARSGLLFSQDRLKNFLALLRTRDIILLAGDSGSGKTSLVRAVAQAIGGTCTIIPVKPNWTSPEDLLGYYNPIDRSFHPTPFLLALQAAGRSPDVPHFVCLDEMNLARVEHYFADFLSLLENRGSQPEIHLYTADEERHLVTEHGIFLELEAEARRRAGLDDNTTLEQLLTNDIANDALHQLGGFRDAESLLVHHGRLRRALSAQMRLPTSVLYPENVWIIGAVNMDETTHHLSPKVLDRVHVLRFSNPMLADWNGIEAEISEVTEDPELQISLTPSDLGLRTEYPAFDRRNDAAAFLAGIARDYLDPLGIEFGLRAVRQSLGYLAAADLTGITPGKALDNVVRQKILPKIALDTSRPTADGRKRRDVLLSLREALAERLGPPEAVNGEGNSVRDLDRLIALADGSNKVANFWMR